jgi:4-hydroxybenzoate polyprenyltransferase
MPVEKPFSLHQKIHAFFQVSRGNLLVASIGHATLGMFLGATVLIDLFQLNVLLYILLHYSIAFFACNINCYFDYQVDRHYKTNLSTSVDIVSKRWLRWIMVVEFCLAVILIWWFYYHGYFLISLLSVMGLIAAYAYSADPFRLKKRGVYSPFLILFLYTLPIVGGWLLFQSHFSLVILLFLIGYVLMNEGFTLVNMCEDYQEDKIEGIQTWAHLFGLRTTLRIAVLFSFSGVLCIIALGLKMMNMIVDVFHIITIGVIILTLGLILKAGMEVFKILSYDDLEDAAKIYGNRLQRWFLMTRYPLMICALLLLI